MTTTYRAAVIGLGNIGLQFDLPPKAMAQSHVLAFMREPGIELVAAVGTRQEHGDNLASVAPEARFYTDLTAMLREQELDIVSICTPSHIRYSVVETVLTQSAARLIFLEKPVATSIAEAERIAALVERHDRTLLVNLSRRFSDSIVRMRAAVRSGRYGKLRNVHLRYTRGVYNYGSHIFDLVRYVAGTIDTVQVLLQVPTSVDAREDWTYTFAFALEGGATGYAEAFDDRDYVIFEMDLYMEKGKIELLQTGDEIRYYAAEEHPMIAGFDRLALERKEEQLLARTSNLQNAAAHLVDVLRGGATPVSTIADGIYPLYVAEALIASHGSGGAAVRVRGGKDGESGEGDMNGVDGESGRRAMSGGNSGGRQGAGQGGSHAGAL